MSRSFIVEHREGCKGGKVLSGQISITTIEGTEGDDPLELAARVISDLLFGDTQLVPGSPKPIILCEGCNIVEIIEYENN